MCYVPCFEFARLEGLKPSYINTLIRERILITVRGDVGSDGKPIPMLHIDQFLPAARYFYEIERCTGAKVRMIKKCNLSHRSWWRALNVEGIDRADLWKFERLPMI